ncbi:HD domain-containing protein [Caulobacter sp. 1776]|uniref:HD domain-containing protein n=1 Tax=Caulobacter sp. 1776 TaxID=3156420 RepID=UPI003393BC72
MTRKVQRVRDPLHNLIQFGDNDIDQTCWNVLNTRPLQRLRRVKQLGFSDYVYPGAAHSRLVHSVGVFHTARQLSEVISDRVGGPSGRFNTRKAHVAIAAALIHDIGHGPFSHAFEHALDGVKLSRKHETRTQAIINGTEISKIFEDAFDSDFPDEVSNIILSRYPADIYASMVSSQFDADRLDYMRRDRIMSGTQQSAIDYEWLLKNLKVGKIDVGVDDTNIKKVETFVLDRKASVAAEGYALSLFYLYINVYFHKTTRGFEKLFTALMENIAHRVIGGKTCGLPANHPIVRYLRNPDGVEEFLRLDDTVVYGALSQLCDSKDHALSELSCRIRDRKPYRCFDVSKYMAATYEAPDDPDSAKRAEARKTARVKTAEAIELIKERKLLQRRDQGIPLILEDEAKRDAYKRDGKISSIYLMGADEKLHDLANISSAVDELGQYHAYRLYYRDEAGKKLIDQIVGEVTK